MASGTEISPSFKIRSGEAVSSFNDQIRFPLPLSALLPLVRTAIVSDSEYFFCL